MKSSVEALRKHCIVIWAKHGVMARSDVSVMRTVDCIEYAETAAKYEYLNLCNGEIAVGLCRDEILAICKAFDLEQDIF